MRSRRAYRRRARRPARARSDEQHARWLLAHLLEWHRREDKAPGGSSSAWRRSRRRTLCDEKHGARRTRVRGPLGGTDGARPSTATAFRRRITTSARADVVVLRGEAVAVDRLAAFRRRGPRTRGPTSACPRRAGPRPRVRAGGSIPTTGAFSSRRCQSSRWASSQRAPLLVVALGRVSGTPARRRSASARERRSRSSITSFGSPGFASGRGISTPLRTSSARRCLEPVAQSRCVEKQSSRLYASTTARPRLDATAPAELEPALDHAQRDAGALERLRAREAVQRLELLERVLLDARAQRLLHDGVEVDEALRAQQSVDLGLARRVAAHQALERRRLVRAEVIDVHAGIGGPARQDRVDQRLEAAALGGPVERPAVMVDRQPSSARSVRRNRDHPAEQVLDPAARRRRGRPRGRGTGRRAKAPAARRARARARTAEQLVQRALLGPRRELDARLLADAPVALLRPARRLPGERQGSTASAASVSTARDCSSRVWMRARCRRRSSGGRRRALRRSHCGHQRQMSQCGTGSGYRERARRTGGSTAASSRRRTSRKYAR